MEHGGKRAGAGRKRKWLEPMTRVYIPVRLKQEFEEWLEKMTKSNEIEGGK